MMDGEDPRAYIDRARRDGRTALDEADGKRLLASFGIAVPRSCVLANGPDAEIPAGLSPPFALKVMSRGILHKTEAGGVRLRLASEAELRAAIAEMSQRIARAGHVIDGWLVEEMAPAGVEMVVGGLHDRRFGPVLMCGLGGILVELMQDVAFAICPVDDTDCREMVAALRGSPLLQGWRGAPAASVASLHEVLLRVGGSGGLLDALGGEIAEIDINPLIVSPSGAVAVDARIVLAEPVVAGGVS
jgi:acetate---CoA ligase (ADP-forming) subunit beta